MTKISTFFIVSLLSVYTAEVSAAPAQPRPAIMVDTRQETSQPSDSRLPAGVINMDDGKILVSTTENSIIAEVKDSIGTEAIFIFTIDENSGIITINASDRDGATVTRTCQ